MIIVNETSRLYLYTAPVDMRKAIDGLSMLLAGSLSQTPTSGDIYIFRNRSGDKVKCLYWHKNGFILHYKRIEKGRFKFPTALREEKLELSAEQLGWLLAGLDFRLMAQCPELNFDNYI